MQLQRKAWRHFISAAALVTLALPLASLSATPVNAQEGGPVPITANTGQPSSVPANCDPSTPATNLVAGTTSTDCYVVATNPGEQTVAFNPIGAEHTVTFICDALVNNLFGLGGTAPGTQPGPTLAPGCYDVVGSVTDLTGGVGTAVSATCGNAVAHPVAGSVDCSTVASPICPVGSGPAPAPGPTTPCTAAAAPFSSGYGPQNTATITINPGANHAYRITFTGYIPTTAQGNCPAGTTYAAGVTLTESFGIGGTGQVSTAPGGACSFSVSVDKKYIEITNVTLSTVPPGSSCGGSLFYAEGLKAFFGPSCTVIASVTGTVVLKTNQNCAVEPANGTPAPTFPGPNAAYFCVNGSLLVENVLLTNVPLSFNVTGSGSFNVLNTLGQSCSGVIGNTSFLGMSGQSVTFCPTGPGAGSIQACTIGGPNNQPGPICSNTISFSFTQNQRKVVPQVRWAGEKIALTKCFGAGLAGSPVEFVLKGNNPGLQATLLPTDLNSTIGATGVFPESDTIWTVTDLNGCASVLGYADGEGVLSVDAAIFNTSGPGLAAGSPIVNEHAFQVFYLKFDHLDLENINPRVKYSVATSLAPYLSLFASSPALQGARSASFTGLSFTLPSAPGANMENAPGAYAVPLCQTQYVRAMVHGYFEFTGDPSGRPATTVAIPGAPLTNGGTASAGSYVLPAGRWVLPEDWPVLATFAGFGLPGQASDFTPSSVLQWDLNSGWVFNPTGENPVFCTGDGLFAAPRQPGGANPGTGPIPGNRVDLGPCFGVDGAGDFYSTAPDGNCAGGQTVGFSGFDPTQSCTTTFFNTNTGQGGLFGTPTGPSFPLTYTPSGASLIGGVGGGTFNCPAGVVGPCLVPNGINSNYLPNGTLNQWDAPMPPAQISFGVTSGPGFLGEVNKTGLYAVTFSLGNSFTCPTGFTYVSSDISGNPVAACVGANGGGTQAPTCNNRGFTFRASTETCQLKVDPNPFYATAIPASPFIPPITNNGGYLWNSWNFSAGTQSAVSGAARFGLIGGGGFVPGQSTTVNIGLASSATIPGGCPNPTYFNGGTTATGCTEPGGINITACSSTTSGDTITVADGRGFLPGMTVEIYSTANGVTILGAGNGSGPVIQSVIPAAGQPGTTGFSNAVELVFLPGALANGACAALPGQEVIIAEQFGIPVPSTAAFAGQATISIGNCANVNGPGQPAFSGCASFPISANRLGPAGAQLLDTTNNIVYVDNTASVAAFFGPCTGSGSGISRAGGPAGNPFCEPNLLVPAGTLLETGPKAAGGITPTQIGPVPNPYPFWQFVAAPPGPADVPTAGTVYSDNHGEAVVTLSTGLSGNTAIAPIVPGPGLAAVCPQPYTPLALNGVVVSCQLPLQFLGSLGFGNIATALKGFSATNPGCIQTSPSGTQFALPTPANGQVVGATGPGAGQICVNNLGGIEFGTAASLGQTTINAVADYPYTREHAPIGSAPLTKVFTSLFEKSLTVSAGTPAPANTTSYVVTITAQDICGNPLFGEPVQVYALGNAGAAVLAPISAGVVLSANTTSSVLTVDPNTGQAVLSLEILNTAIGTQGLVIKAVFPFEKVERFYTVIAGSTPGATVTVNYAPGWNQVGGPANSNFSVVEALYSYDPVAGQYTNVSSSAGNLSSAAPACTGYWAYFAAPMAVSLNATSHAGDTATCTLGSGWNLVGNSFASPATIPSGLTAYHWNGTSYDVVGQIPTGGSVWIFNDGTHGTVTLTAT